MVQLKDSHLWWGWADFGPHSSVYPADEARIQALRVGKNGGGAVAWRQAVQLKVLCRERRDAGNTCACWLRTICVLLQLHTSC